MEWIRKCPVFFLLTVSGLVFSLVGLVGMFSAYRGYEFHVVRQPFLALMMEGIDRGVMPWEACGIRMSIQDAASEAVAEAGGVGQSIEDFAGAEPASASDGENLPEGGQIDSGGGAEAVGSTEGNEGEVGEGEAGGEVSAVADSTVETEAGREDTVTYEFQEVSEDYFNDAVFIGDSRTVGMYEYGGIEERADFFAKISLTIYDVFTKPVAKDGESGEWITVEDALMKKQYGKVYLMLGINELGTGTTEIFLEEYAAAVERIRELQPDALIFVEGIMRVTGEKNESDPIFNNTNINEKNDAIATLANNRDIFYIDVNEVVCDENGNLNSEYTIDEVHLKARYYGIWKEFLLQHGVIVE